LTTPLIDLTTAATNTTCLPPGAQPNVGGVSDSDLQLHFQFTVGYTCHPFQFESPEGEIPMRHKSLLFAAVLAIGFYLLTSAANANESLRPRGDGKRRISYQHQKDLFYNYYANPGPYNGAAAEMYVAPRPVPPFVGHTWVTYQPLMPHEFLYKHQRSYYTYNRGAGWRRTNVRYGTFGLRAQDWWTKMHYPMSNNAWALHNDVHYPGLRF
jgi:hypothetical protein